jgi:hypothetical protein
MLQLERSFLQSDAAQVRALMEACAEGGDPIGQHQYALRLKHLEQELSEVAIQIPLQPASVALLFGGVPVLGSNGIQLRFATQAVEQFQKIVTQRYASKENGKLASRGRVPGGSDANLLVTDVARGSFGFVLESQNSSPEIDQALKAVIDDVATTLEALAVGRDLELVNVAEAVDDRQLTTLKDFVKLLDDEGATLRLVEGEREVELDRTSIGRARLLLDTLEVRERSQVIEGTVVGWAQFSHRFELKQLDDLPVITGSVERELMERVNEQGLNPLNKSYRATVTVREFKSKGRQPRQNYRLMELNAGDSNLQQS